MLVLQAFFIECELYEELNLRKKKNKIVRCCPFCFVGKMSLVELTKLECDDCGRSYFIEDGVDEGAGTWKSIMEY